MTPPPWPAEQVHAWFSRHPAPQGFNYLPRTAVNSLEMWQAETFDPATIAQELGWAAKLGYTSARVFLPFAVWRHDRSGFKARLEHVLDVLQARGMTLLPILFDDCAFAGREPELGPQAPPVPGVHNSGWVPSPGPRFVLDPEAWPLLREYVQDLVFSFGHDERVLAWDLYNEPGNSGMDGRSLPLLEETFAWARQAAPTQPLTAGPWNIFESPMSRRMFELSDVISFHAYEGPFFTRAKLDFCARFGRPMLCTEWLHRPYGNTFAAILPLFREYGVGWYQWGLVSGRTQTHLPWGGREGDDAPELWQHDLLHEDGAPYDADELRHLLRGERQTSPT